MGSLSSRNVVSDIAATPDCVQTATGWLVGWSRNCPDSRESRSNEDTAGGKAQRTDEYLCQDGGCENRGRRHGKLLDGVGRMARNDWSSM